MNPIVGVPLQLRFRMEAMRGIALRKGAKGKTKADRVLDRQEHPLAASIHKALMHQAHTISRQIAGRYSAHMHKAVPAWAADLIDEIDTEGVGIAVRDAVSPATQEVFRRAGLTALAEVDVDISGASLQHMDAEAQLYARTRSAELVTSISNTTRDTLRDLITDGIEQGWSSQSLAFEVSSSVAFSDERSLMVARTELAFAHAQGNLIGYKAGGIERKQWLASEDACEHCEEADGKSVDIDDDFIVDGEEIDAPPAHPNCRCDVLPVIEATA